MLEHASGGKGLGSGIAVMNKREGGGGGQDDISQGVDE